MKTHFTGWPTWYWEYCVVGSVCWYRYGYWYWHLNLQPRTNQEIVRVSFHFCEKKIRRRISVDWWNKTTVNTVHIVNPGFLYIYWVPGTVCIIERFMIHDIYSIIAAVHKLSEINIYIKTSQCGLCLFHRLLQTPGNTGRLASLQTCKKKSETRKIKDFLDWRSTIALMLTVLNVDVSGVTFLAGEKVFFFLTTSRLMSWSLSLSLSWRRPSCRSSHRGSLLLQRSSRSRSLQLNQIHKHTQAFSHTCTLFKETTVEVADWLVGKTGRAQWMGLEKLGFFLRWHIWVLGHPYSAWPVQVQFK